MAITKIKSIKSTLKKAIDYICDENKTDGQLLVTGGDCSPETAYLEFKMTEEMANDVVGDYNKKNKNLAYHTIQSFDVKDKITPEQAHEIGKQLAEELCGGHEYVLATHIDKGHIHNHIIFNAYNSETLRKFDCNKNTFKDIRAISDRLCEENGLNVIKEPKEKGKSYVDWLGKKGTYSWKKILKITIDKNIEGSNNFEEFLKAMRTDGYEIKEGKHSKEGTYIAFKAEGQDKFTRCTSNIVGVEYTEEIIKSRIINKAYTIEKDMLVRENSKEFVIKVPDSSIQVTIDKGSMHWNTIKDKLLLEPKEDRTYSFMNMSNYESYDIDSKNLINHYDKLVQENRIERVKLVGSLENCQKLEFKLDRRLIYENRKQQIVDIKKLSKTLLLINKEDIKTYKDIGIRINELKDKSNDIRKLMKQLERKNRSYNQIAKYLITYNNNLEIYNNYGNLKTKFGGYKKYEGEILSFIHAKEKLQELGIKTNIDVSKVMDIVKEQTRQVNELSNELKSIEKRASELKEANENIEQILNNDIEKNDRQEEQEI